MHDLLIKSGLVVDGTGGAPHPADIDIDDGLITAVEGRITAPARPPHRRRRRHRHAGGSWTSTPITTGRPLGTTA